MDAVQETVSCYELRIADERQAAADRVRRAQALARKQKELCELYTQIA